MKYITLIIGLLVVGCGKQEQTDTNESTPTTNTNKADGTTEKPVKELTLEEKVVGSYEVSEEAGDTFKLVLLDNGRFEIHSDGKKVEEGTWKIDAKEVHVLGDGKEVASVMKIESNGDLTHIANIGEERTELPFRKDRAFKKIK